MARRSWCFAFAVIAIGCFAPKYELVDTLGSGGMAGAGESAGHGGKGALAGSSGDNDAGASGSSTDAGGASSGTGGATAGTSGSSSGAAGSAAAGGGPNAGAGGSTAGASGSTSGGGGSTSGSGGAGAGSGGSGGTPSLCDTFCADEQATCGFGVAAIAPYTTLASCQSHCAAFPLGVGGATSGDSFYCRRYHLSAAAANGGAAKATHCPHTGWVSKASYSDATATGPCAN